MEPNSLRDRDQHHIVQRVGSKASLRSLFFRSEGVREVLDRYVAVPRPHSAWPTYLKAPEEAHIRFGIGIQTY